MIIVGAGTPSHQETKTYDDSKGSDARKFIDGRISNHAEWASKFNGEVARRLALVKEEFGNINLRTLPLDQERRWQVEDDVTGVKFVFTVKRVEG